MDILIIFIGTVLLAVSVALKVDILFMAAFLIAAINDFIRISIIQKKQDERALLIKTKSDGLTYFIIFGVLVVMLSIAIKRPALFGSVPDLLCIILTAICLIHSMTLSIFNRKY